MEPQAPASPLLSVLQDEVQIAALSFLGIVYVLKVLWMFRFPSRPERTFAAGSARAGIAISMANIFLPWQMESTRRNLLFYVQFALFHLGVLTAIAISFVIPYGPRLLDVVWAKGGAIVLLAAALLVGVARLVRRIRSPALRRVNSIDDFLALGVTLAFFASAIPAIATVNSESEAPRIAFFALTAAFLVYVPFSKICHYLFYPFTRFFLGRTLGHRGVLAPAGSRKRGGSGA